jgi:hypothetical protein
MKRLLDLIDGLSFTDRWIPAFAGMTRKAGDITLSFLLLLSNLSQRTTQHPSRFFMGFKTADN